MIGPIILSAKYADLIKDIILVYRLQFSLGGFGVIFAFYDRFSSMVSILSMEIVLIYLTWAQLK